jgi:hypothetical protein
MISDAVQLATERAWREQEGLEANKVTQLGLPGISEEQVLFPENIGGSLASSVKNVESAVPVDAINTRK